MKLRAPAKTAARKTAAASPTRVDRRVVRTVGGLIAPASVESKDGLGEILRGRSANVV
jgi:hypothetical protein